MTDVNRLLEDLAEQARCEDPPPIDICEDVMSTLSAQPRVVGTDYTPVAIATVAISVAATVVFAFLPAWEAMSNPWVALLP